MRDVKGIELRTASKIYVNDNAELNPEFSAITKDVFNSEVKKVDFTKNVETAKEINTWVNSSTVFLVIDNKCRSGGSSLGERLLLI